LKAEFKNESSKFEAAYAKQHIQEAEWGKKMASSVAMRQQMHVRRMLYNLGKWMQYVAMEVREKAKARKAIADKKYQRAWELDYKSRRTSNVANIHTAWEFAHLGAS